MKLSYPLCHPEQQGRFERVTIRGLALKPLNGSGVMINIAISAMIIIIIQEVIKKTTLGRERGSVFCSVQNTLAPTQL